MLHGRAALLTPARLAAQSGVLVSALLCVPPTAHAEGADVFTFSAASALVQDSNLFRLPSNANLPALIGSDSASEQITITTLGVKASKDYSLQRIELDWNLANYHYQNFNYLNNTANNYSAAWRWSVTPRVHGNLTTDRKETLNDFADVSGYKQRNQRTNVTTQFDGTYELNGAWRLGAGASEATQTNPQNQVEDANTVTRSLSTGLRYEYASKSQWGYKLTSSKGSYQTPVNAPSNLIDDSFDQTNHDFTLLWVVNGKSNANLRITALNRSHPRFSQRDFSGINGAAYFNLSVTGKTALALALTRDLSSYQSATSNYTQTDRISLTASWKLWSKTQLWLRHEMAQRDYLGSPLALPSSTVHRCDTLRDTTLSLNWQPQPHLSINTSIQDSRRSVNLANLDYQSTTASVSAQISF